MGPNRCFTRARLATILALWLAAGLAGAAPASARPGAGAASAGYPNAIAATGDSITRAYNTGPNVFTDYPANSWSTGTAGAVNSHYARILAANPAIGGRAYNDAVSGAKMINLNAQVANVNAQGVDYVTILMGGNDACTPSEAAMTPVATYAAQFQTALNTLAAGSPDARIFVLSVPNIYHLWATLKDNPTARAVWSTFSICQSMLQNPLSTAQADVDRRARVRQRVIDYNTQLATICAANIHCRFDDNAVFNYPFAASDISTRDYFHPSTAGQANFATFSYAAGFDFSDNLPPVTTLALSVPLKRGLIVALSASDAAGVAGIEYRLDGGPYTRYTGPLTLAAGSKLTYRAVDVNGNVEAAQSLAAP